MLHLEKTSWIAAILGTLAGIVSAVLAWLAYFHPLPSGDAASSKQEKAFGAASTDLARSAITPPTGAPPPPRQAVAAPAPSVAVAMPRSADAAVAAPSEATVTAAPPPSPRERYLHETALVPGVKAVAFRGDPLIARELIAQLPQPVSVNFFKPSFFADGLFEQALLGDTTGIRSMNLGDAVNAIYLVQIAPVHSVTQAEHEGLVFAQAELRVVSIDPRTGAVLKAAGATLEGRGFSPQKALAELRGDVERKAAGLLPP